MSMTRDTLELYGDDWPHLSWNIVVRRAGGRCECHGHCGREDEHLEPVDGRCRNRHGQPRWRGKPGQRPVILSTAHLNDSDPGERDPAKLIGMCEPCHLAYDVDRHWATRRRNEEAAMGLIPLIELADLATLAGVVPHGARRAGCRRSGRRRSVATR